MTRRRHRVALGLAATFSFSACAGASDSVDTTPDAEPTPEASAEPEQATPAADPTPDADEPAPDEPDTEEPDTEQPDASESDPDESDTEPAAAVDVPAPPELGGRMFAEAVQASSQFETNPFPDLVVDDVGREAKANLANILPSDRPVLLWTFAPH